MIYLAPLKKWVVNVLEGREKNPKLSNKKMPFIVMTSGAKVLKSDSKDDTKEKVLEKIKNIVNKKAGAEVEYSGCIISNQINPTINYSNGYTLVGFDFTGKAITAKEFGRKISPPIIESLEIETLGTNNALKEARVNVRCFSLKQFEMFELFYCKAGMHILIEYGDNSAATILNDVMIPKTDYDKFVETFKSFTNPTTKQFGEYIDKCKTSNGSYDRVAGKLVNYTYSIEQDGTYTITITVTQSNEYNLALPKTFIINNSYFETPNVIQTGIEQWKRKLVKDLPGLNPKLIEASDFNDKWKNHFFNWGKTNETKLDELASNTPYLSLHFILKVLMNNPVAEGPTAPEFIFEIPEFKVGNSKIPFIPISLKKNIISNTEDVIFPNKHLPKFDFDTITNETKILNDTEDGTINGLNIIESNKILFEYIDENGKELSIPVEPKPGLVIGNACNIFVNYKIIGEAWEKNYKIGDFLIDILNKINDAGYELFRLRVGNLREVSKATVLDVLLTSTSDKLKNEQDDVRKQYRFKPTTINSNVRNFKFNFELGDTLAAVSVFNAAKFLYGIKENNLDKPENGISLLKGLYQSIDYSSFSTSDGYFAINEIDFHQLTSVGNPGVSKIPDEKVKQQLREQILKDAQDKQKLYNILTKKFKIKKGDIKTLVFEDKAFLSKNLGLNDAKVRNKYELLTPITVNVIIDGISGITCGETFKVDGVPEQYNRLGSFQITNTKHVVNNEQGWITEIEGTFRYGA